MAYGILSLTSTTYAITVTVCPNLVAGKCTCANPPAQNRTDTYTTKPAGDTRTDAQWAIDCANETKLIMQAEAVTSTPTPAVLTALVGTVLP